MDPRIAIVLLSGGIDSATCLAVARSEGFRCFALTVDYGQRHRVEVDAASRVARHLAAERHEIVELNLDILAHATVLLDQGCVPKGRTVAEIGSAIPPTYVPARNTVLLALALSWAEALRARTIFLGANAEDRAGYPDCRAEFLSAFEALARLGTKAGVLGVGISVRVPFIESRKAEIILRGRTLGVDYSLTHSCFDPSPNGSACRHCDACVLRLHAFAEIGLADPADSSAKG